MYATPNRAFDPFDVKVAKCAEWLPDGLISYMMPKPDHRW
jgi:hypothetical protein